MREYFAPVTTAAFGTAVNRTLRTTTMIVSLLIGAYLISYFLTATGTTPGVVTFITQLPVNRYVLLAVIILTSLVLGLFRSPLEISVLTLPLVFPRIVPLDSGPIWFGATGRPE